MLFLERDKKAKERIREKINNLPFPHEDVHKNSSTRIYISVVDIIAAKGYTMEIHTITTEDRYLLKAWRLYKDGATFKHKYPMY